MILEPRRRNGFYCYKERQVPSVSTILRSAGSPGGLIDWACKQGGLGVIWGLSKIKDIGALQEKLGSPSCIEWAIEQAKMGLESEGDRVKGFGTEVHAGMEATLKKINLDMSEWSDDMKIALETFLKFYDDIGFDPSSVECTIYSNKYGFAGRADLVMEINEEQVVKLKPYLTRNSDTVKPGRVMTDLKTGKMYPKSQIVQLAAYRQAYNETYGHLCTGGLIINIERNKPSEIKCHYVDGLELDQVFEEAFIPALNVWKYFDAPAWFHKQEKNNNQTLKEAV